MARAKKFRAPSRQPVREAREPVASFNAAASWPAPNKAGRPCKRCRAAGKGVFCFTHRDSAPKPLPGAEAAGAGASAGAGAGDLQTSNNPRLQQLFDAFDADGDGRVTSAELQHTLRRVGEELSETQARLLEPPAPGPTSSLHAALRATLI